MLEARNDVVGSLLRPPALLEARALRDRGELASAAPHCGSATSILGNALTFDKERAKLRTIVETAAVVWG